MDFVPHCDFGLGLLTVQHKDLHYFRKKGSIIMWAKMFKTLSCGGD